MKSEVQKTKYYSSGEGMAKWLATICAYVLPVCMFFILVGNPIKSTFLVSWATRIQIIITFAVGVVAVLSGLINGIKERSATLLVILIFTTALCLLSCGMGAVLGSIIPYLCFFMLPFYIVTFKKIDSLKTIKKAVFIWNIIYALWFIFLSFTDLAHVFYGEYGLEYLDEITLGYSNPNETGIYLLISFIIMLAAFEENCKGNRWFKMATLILSVALFILVFETKSRICMLLASIVAITKIFKMKSIKKDWFILLCFLIPAISLLTTILVQNLFEGFQVFLEDVGTGRDLIYKALFDNLNVFTFFLGDFAVQGTSNWHNSYVSIFARFGVLGFIVFIIFLYVSFKEYRNGLDEDKFSTPFVGLLCVILHGIAEATLLVAGVVYGGYVGLLFLLTMKDKREEKSSQIIGG